MLHRRRYLFAAALACVVPLLLMGRAAQTQTDAKEKKHPIDAIYDACLEKRGSNAGMMSCANEAEASWDKQMNKDYQTLLKRTSAKTQAKFRDSQRAWLAFRDKEQKAMDALCSRNGTKWGVVYAESSMRLVRARALQMADYVENNDPL